MADYADSYVPPIYQIREFDFKVVPQPPALAPAQVPQPPQPPFPLPIIKPSDHYFLIDFPRIIEGQLSSLQLHVSEFVRLVDCNRFGVKRRVFGVSGSEGNKVWGHWTTKAYAAEFVADIDAAVLGWFRSIALNESMTPSDVQKSKIVLVTGGNVRVSEYLDIARRAVERGWHIEVHGWKISLSDAWLTFCGQFPHQVSVKFINMLGGAPWIAVSPGPAKKTYGIP